MSDDATKRVLHAAFYPTGSQQAVMTSLAAVLRADGLPMALYTGSGLVGLSHAESEGPR